MKLPRCYACNKRVRLNQHELVLSDFMTGQVVGHYHARPECQRASAKYITGGVALSVTFIHPDRCGENQEQCDGELSEWAA
jgi:hypothetical protein